MKPAPSLSPLPPPPAAGWYCVRVLARREHVAARNLQQRAGVRVFSPRIRVRRKSAGTAPATTTEALFPGYVFARFTYPHELRRVTSTPGVVGLVSFGGRPPVVADGIIDRLDREVNRAATAALAPQFEEGAWVRIVAGCFRGSEGRVLHPAVASSRICVLLVLLGQEVQVSVACDQLAGRAHHHQVPAGLRAGDSLPSLPR